MGSAVMALAGLGFIGYAVMFFVRNFTNSFLELGIGHNEVSVGKDEIKAFSPSLYEYIGHLHIAISGFIAATGLAVVALAWFGVRRGQVWAWVAAVAAPVLALAVTLPTIRMTSTPSATSGSSTPTRCSSRSALSSRWLACARLRPCTEGTLKPLNWLSR